MSHDTDIAALVMLFCVCLLAWGAGASAADNSQIIVIEKSQRSTPFGSYRSERETQVFGPSSGYRYEQYSTPGPDRVIITPYGYGVARGAPGQGRVFEHPGSGVYGRFGAGTAPRVGGYSHPYGSRSQADGAYGHSRYRAHRGHRHEQRAHRSFGRDPSARQITPGQRAMRPAERAIGRDGRR